MLAPTAMFYIAKYLICNYPEQGDNVFENLMTTFSFGFHELRNYTDNKIPSGIKNRVTVTNR